MIVRRGLLRVSVLLLPFGLLAAEARIESRYWRLRPASGEPAFSEFAVDSLGKNASKLRINLVHPPEAASARFHLRRTGAKWAYRGDGAAENAEPAWSLALTGKKLTLRSAAGGPPFVLRFNNVVCHATLLGHMGPDGSVRLPALLNLPDFGTIRITANRGASLGYDASRGKTGDFVKVEFPAGVEYEWELVTLFPGPVELERDGRFDAYRRGFLTIFQLNPRMRTLANHSASDPAALTFFQYSLVARHAPPLAEGLTAMDLIRFTLDRHLAGFVSYGMKGYKGIDPRTERYPWDSLDTHPSLVSAAVDYVEATGDVAWLKANYAGIRGWAQRIVNFDSDQDGLIESPLSGNSGSWKAPMQYRPANWWDTIGYGHKDAYSNALAFRALRGMSHIAAMAGRQDDAASYARSAAALKAAYYRTFFNPSTGVLAGWVSADGRVHDYYFTSVNGLAIASGLVPEEQANRIMDRMLAKMKEVGFRRFELGLPGNLVPVRREDYTEASQRYGGSKKEDGSDGFQIYENGGATACHVYWTVQALYDLGRRADAEKILLPVLRAFEEGRFQGRSPDGIHTYDWKAWDGTPHGYEGLLVDNYLTLLAVYTGHLGKR